MENEKKNIIVRLQDFLETQKGQTILNYLYSWGAAIVILGALFKLTHIKGADIMLWIGMGTEVLVFFISGFDRQASSLGSGEASESGAGTGTGAGPIVIGGGVPVVGGAPAVGGAPSTVAAASAGEVAPLDAESLAAMANLAAANAAAAAASAAAGPVVIGGGAPVAAGEPLPEGIELPEGAVVGAAPTVIGEAPTIIGHGGTVDIPEMEKITTEYIDRLRELTEAFTHVAEQASNLEGSADEMERLSRNLTSINTIYELHLKSLGSQITNIDTVNEQTRRMADQIEELNTVYKRMLESMTVNMGVRGNVPTEE